MRGEFKSVKDLEDFVNKHHLEGVPKVKYVERNLIDYIREKEKAKMEGLAEGRIVHFVLDKQVVTNETDNESDINANKEIITCRPAIIVDAWEGKLEDGMINLQIFLDGSNDNNLLESIGSFPILADRVHCINFAIWKTFVKHSENKEIGTWHWPERS